MTSNDIVRHVALSSADADKRRSNLMLAQLADETTIAEVLRVFPVTEIDIDALLRNAGEFIYKENVNAANGRIG